MLKKILIVVLFLISVKISAQVDSYKLGSPITGYRQQGGYFDYSDPQSVNFTVSIWGFVKFPGKYLVPINTSVTDLISYAGGPIEKSELDELRIYRKVDGQDDRMIKFSFDDLLWQDDLEFKKRYVPELQADDILLVPGNERFYFSNWFSLTLGIISALSTLVILILNLKNN